MRHNEISIMVSVMIHDDSHTEQNVQVFQDINVRRHTISLDTDGRVREVTTLTQTGQPAHSGLAKTHDLHCRAISGKQNPTKTEAICFLHPLLPSPPPKFHLIYCWTPWKERTAAVPRRCRYPTIPCFVALTHFVHPRPTVESISPIYKACFWVYFCMNIKSWKLQMEEKQWLMVKCQSK